MRATVALVVIALAALPPRAASAQAEPNADIVFYRAKQGDSLALVAAEFYGDRTKANFIQVANKLERPRALRPGERLKIPVSRPYTTSPGDTFETIAANYLGDARRGTFLAEFNGLPPDERMPSGTDLFIPFTLTHHAEATQSIGKIASEYFGNEKNATLLRRYNFLGDKETLEKGETLIVPIYNLRLQASKLPPIDAESLKRREKQKKVQARAAKALPAAKLAWREGDYAQVKAMLVGIEPDADFLETSVAVEVGLLFGAVQLAFEDSKAALAAFQRVLERKPGHLLSPYYFSPKVLAVWKEAGGAPAGDAP